MSRAGRTLAILGATAYFVAASRADAAECTNPLVNPCIQSDTFWPNPGPMRFATVAGTETVAPGLVGLGLITTYQSRPIVLRVATPGPGGSTQSVVNDQVSGNFLFAYGVSNRLQLDLAMPVTVVQSGAGLSPLTGGAALKSTAVRDLRFGLAYALVPRERTAPSLEAPTHGPGQLWALTARFVVQAPTGDHDQFAGERTAVFAPALSGDLRYKRLFAGVDVGMRIRPITEFAGARVGTQIATGLGVGVDVLDRELLSFAAEARTYVNLAEQHETAQSAFGITSRPNGTFITPAEWMLTARSAPVLAGDVSFFAGGGGPIPFEDVSITVPRFRFLLGFSYAPVARDTDRDGVLDKNDACPNEAGRRSESHSGCPARKEETPP
jgi:hypothetical protein